MNLAQNCICFTNLCMNLFVLPSVTRLHHSKLPEFLDSLKCVVAYLHRPLTRISKET